MSSSQDHPAGTGEEVQARAMGWPLKRPGDVLVAGNLMVCVQSIHGNDLLWVTTLLEDMKQGLQQVAHAITCGGC